MNSKVSRVVGCNESCKGSADDNTLVLVNTGSSENSAKFTDLKINDKVFSQVSNQTNSDLKVNSQGKVIINFSDKEGVRFPGVRVSELQVVDGFVNLKIESGDLISLVSLNSSEEFPDELVERVIDICRKKELVWTKF